MFSCPRLPAFIFLLMPYTAFSGTFTIQCPEVKNIHGNISDCIKPNCFVSGSSLWNNIKNNNIIYPPGTEGGPDTQYQLDQDIAGMTLTRASADPAGYNRYLLRCHYENRTMQRGTWFPMYFQLEYQAKKCTLTDRTTFQCD